MGFRQWRKARVRAIGRDYYVRFTPNFGFSLPWFGKDRDVRGVYWRRRVRFAWHHGLQLVVWRSSLNANGEYVGRWIVKKQLLGKSRVKGEIKHASVRNT